MKRLAPYLPGIILFFVALAIGLCVYQDYGIAWDEPTQRDFGIINYNYVFNGDQALLSYPYGFYGVGIELPLVCIEKWFKITDVRDIYLMRHLVTHVLFLLSALAGYALALRLFKNNFIACIGFILLLSPRIYAHSFFNSKDAGFLAMFLITLAFCEYAFAKNKPGLIFILGLLCGYTTGIRIMALMLDLVIVGFLLTDLVMAFLKKENVKRHLLGILLFAVGFCIAVCAAWPFLWKDPVHNFIYAYNAMSHYDYNASSLFGGKMIPAADNPWYYSLTWFLITTPEVWVVCGAAGILWLFASFCRRPLQYIHNTTERNFGLYALCFFTPLLAIFIHHSIVYDDWRHLYFIYPPFVMMALWFINKLVNSRFRLVIISACVVQVALVGYFMVTDHPFEQVYFNSFVSHKPEYLREHYDLDYWGCGFKQALDHLITAHPDGPIKIQWTGSDDPLTNNVMMLQQRDRSRIERVKTESDYFITDFRLHPDDYPYPGIEYSVKALNSTILCVYKTH